MKGTSHALTGWLGGAAIAWAYTSSPTLRIGLGLATTGTALAPDWDMPRSLISKSLPPLTSAISWLVQHLSKLAYYATRTAKDKRAEGTHRYLTHTALWSLSCGATAGAVAAWYGVPTNLSALIALAIALGGIIHILGDDLTESGVPFFWPIKIHGQRWYRCHLLPKWLRITTGNTEEEVWVYLVFLPPAIVVVPGVWPVLVVLVKACWSLLWTYF